MLPIQEDLWQFLARADRPILLYGMGNGADKILDVCAARNIPVADVFASDGFVRGQIFHGKRVLSFSEAEARYGDMIVLLSFATSRPEVYEAIARVAARHTLLVPDVPVTGTELFDLAYYRAHAAEFAAARALLSDEASRDCFDRVIEGKITGSLSTILDCAVPEEEPWDAILCAQNYTTYCDLGAYNGDTIRDIASRAPHLQQVFAMEPDPRNFRKLNEWAQTVSDFTLTSVCAAAWETDGDGLFAGSGNRNAALTTASAAMRKNDGKRQVVALMRPDTLLAGHAVDLIKYDVEGAEREAILGTRETIAAHAPDLIVSAYHRPSDLFVLPLLLSELQPQYRFALRKLSSIPMWDVNLYATKK